MGLYGHKVVKKCGLPPSAWHYIPGRAYINHQAYTYRVRGYTMHRKMWNEALLHLAPIVVPVVLAIFILWIRQSYSSSSSHSSSSSSQHSPPFPLIAFSGDSDLSEDSVSSGFSISSFRPVDEARYKAFLLNPDL